jgi:hypothetical protein
MTGRKKAPATPLHDRLAELRDAIVTAKRRAREVELEHQAAQAEVERIGEARVEAFAAGDEPLADDLQAERVSAEQAVRDFAERVAGAERAVQHAEAEHARFARANLGGLLAERTEDARKVAADVEAAVQALQAAHRNWNAMDTEVGALFGLAEVRTHRATFPQALENLVRDARRASGVSVPPPLPDAPRVLSAPEHDPDPAVRAAARGRLTTDSADAA